MNEWERRGRQGRTRVRGLLVLRFHRGFRLCRPRCVNSGGFQQRQTSCATWTHAIESYSQQQCRQETRGCSQEKNRSISRFSECKGMTYAHIQVAKHSSGLVIIMNICLMHQRWCYCLCKNGCQNSYWRYFLLEMTMKVLQPTLISYFCLQNLPLNLNTLF